MNWGLTNREIPSSRLSPMRLFTSKAPNSSGTRRGVDSGSNQQRDTRNCCDLRSSMRRTWSLPRLLDLGDRDAGVAGQNKTGFHTAVFDVQGGYRTRPLLTKGAVLYLIYMRI